MSVSDLPNGNITALKSTYVYVIARFLDERDRGEAEVEFIRKTCYNLLLTWLLCLQVEKLIARMEIFVFHEELSPSLT